VPIARLAAAHAALKYRANGGKATAAKKKPAAKPRAKKVLKKVLSRRK
jgi:hypothetical protein